MAPSDTPDLITIMHEPLLFELSTPGHHNDYLCALDVPTAPFDFAPRADLPLPQLDEHSVVRHYTRLSQQNFSIDTHFYPLGSCTMKYNPKVNDLVASMPGFASVHPLQPEATVQGWLQVLYEAQIALARIAGLDAATVQPLAGAQGEFCGLLMIRGFHRSRGEGTSRTRIVVPDSAHGTNPASAARCGFEVAQVPSGPDGCVDLEAMEKALGADVAAVMITNPNTLGVFERDIERLCEMAHQAGALVYMDGANMNAILGAARPGDMGVDVMHFNVHKTFSTPHGGGGPGAGPVAVRAILEPFLPAPLVVRRKMESGKTSDTGASLTGASLTGASLTGASLTGASLTGASLTGASLPAHEYSWDSDRPQSVGALHAFWGNAGVVLRALTYIRRLGESGLKEVSQDAVLSANYVLARLRGAYETANENCKHECVLSAAGLKARHNVSAWDIAKRLPDFGFHAPTVYFPTIVRESLMIEPTETETKATLDAFCDAMLQIADEAASDSQSLRHAPHTLAVGRLDEANAARCLNLCWTPRAEENSCQSNGDAKREVPQASTY